MDLFEDAWATLRRLEALAEQVGLQYVELPEAAVSVGLAVGFSEVDFVVVSVLGGDEGQTFISCGVLKDVVQDEVAALRTCNRLTRDRPAYPIYLHEAPIGWDILLSTACPTPLLLNNAQYYAMLLRGLPAIAAEAREVAIEEKLGGVPYRWNPHELQRLLNCSAM